MGLVIDTNFFINVENNNINIDKLDAFYDYGDAYIAAITVAELLTGVHMAKNIETRIKRNSFVEGIISKIPVLDFDEKVARTYSEIYAHLITNRNKNTMNTHDLLIASTAIAHGFPVLTSNIQDFEKIPGIKIVSPYSHKNK